MMPQEMQIQIAIAALSVAYLFGGVVKRVFDWLMPPPHVGRQLELLKSIDERLEKMNGALATTLDVAQHNGDGIKELKRCFVPGAQNTPEGDPRWWCHWPRVKGELMGILEEIRGMLKKKEA